MRGGSDVVFEDREEYVDFPIIKSVSGLPGFDDALVLNEKPYKIHRYSIGDTDPSVTFEVRYSAVADVLSKLKGTQEGRPFLSMINVPFPATIWTQATTARLEQRHTALKYWLDKYMRLIFTRPCFPLATIEKPIKQICDMKTEPPGRIKKYIRENLLPKLRNDIKYLGDIAEDANEKASEIQSGVNESFDQGELEYWDEKLYRANKRIQRINSVLPKIEPLLTP
jgi:hypothetical protein